MFGGSHLEKKMSVSKVSKILTQNFFLDKLPFQGCAGNGRARTRRHGVRLPWSGTWRVPASRVVAPASPSQLQTATRRRRRYFGSEKYLFYIIIFLNFVRL